ncbi:MFS transporter [Bhargavaea beijingensis]|uniref:MFS transporter n=1 Tax=Bhargavaea beijingensis TaxID=426756 RepID=A0A1G7F8G3_9BACL|nr:MFS transporter [Bhargavaea beijingensis]MCW1927680.1 MFS transporter [Bhargavaea beijingensis]RSK33340.1 MFS transporter [Bhargavaea beijingensis]SDE72126.1 Major Facilitator Superfamily protein [Bhargavaea beijingensis]
MKKSILLLMSVQFLVYLGFGIIIPVLPEVVVAQGFAEMHVGGLLTVYALASFFTAPLWGAYSDRTGRKKLIAIGLAGFSLSFFLFAAFTHSLAMMYVSRAVGGLFSGALYTAVTGFVADLTDEENRNKYMGLLGMSIGLGFIFGPAIGGILGDISLSLPFTASGTLVLLLLVYAMIILKEPERKGEANKRSIVPEGAGKLWRYRIRYLFIMSFMVTFLLAGIEATFQLFQMHKIEITPKQIGYLFLFSGLVDAAIQGGVVRRVKNGMETKVILIAQVVTAAGLALMVFTGSLFWAGLSLCVFTAGNALARTVLVSLTTKESGGRYGTAAGMSYSMDNVGRIAGPLLFTWLFTQMPDGVYWISAALALLSVGLIFLYRKSGKSLRETAVS